MAKIRHLAKKDLNGVADSRRPGEVVLRHLDGPPLDYTLAWWHKNIGDEICIGDVIATVATNQFTLDIEVFEEGTVVEHLFATGSLVPCGATLARIAHARKKPNNPPKP